MQKIAILGLAVAISMVSCIVSVAEAEPIPSPYQQVRDGTPMGAVVCAGDRMLMLSPSGEPACVFASSVDALVSRGFVLVSEAVPDAFKTGYRPFVTTWRTASPNESITIPAGRSTGAYTIDWGDGTVTSATGDASHAYASPREYQVVISGDFTRIYLNGSPNAKKLQSIDQWGDIQWESMNSAFEGATNMVYRANDAPNLSNVTDMSKMFLYADSFNGDLSDWDVSGVRNMSCMFAGATSFNGDLSAWDVSKVRNMSCMFAALQFFYVEIFSEYFAFAPPTSFDGDLSDWDVSGVTDMSGMFAGASSFDGDLSAWDVSGATDMRGMFARAPSFDGDISGWDVSEVRNMSCMFFVATSFNGDLSAWDVSKVRNTSCMFAYASSFNGDLSTWDVSSVNDMRHMFWNSRSFNSNLSDWDVSGVSDMYGAFSRASSFDGDISGWNVSKVVDMTEMFYEASSFDGDLSAWDVSNVKGMSYMLAGATSFDSDLSAWDVSGGTDMRGMFYGASYFSHNLGDWYITLDSTSISVGDCTEVIENIAAQNWFLDRQDITYEIGSGGDSALFEIDGDALKIKPSADYSGKTEYAVTITSTGGFSRDNFRVINVTVTEAGDIRFEQAQADAAPFITTWRTASPNESITIPVGGAAGAYAVDWGDGSTSANVTGDQSHAYEDAGTYTVAITGNFERIYLNGDLINAPKLQSIEQWGGTKWISMDSAFEGAHGMIYNADDVPDLSGVTDMRGMFARASSFDGDLSAWNVSGGTDMRGMFYGASSFSHNLGDWYITLDSTSISVGDGTEVIGNIAAQNWFLDRQDITYEIGSGGDSALFEIDGDALKIKPSADYSGKTEYAVTITSTGGFSRDNFRVINVTVTEAGDIRFEQAQADAAPFITTWRTASPNESITIPVGGAAGAYAVDWGDGSTSANVTGDQSHAYEDAGTYTVAITGNFERIYLNGDLINAPKLQSIEQWGGTKWISMDSAFEGAHGMIYNADDVPDLSGVTDMRGMFARASSFDGDLSAWNVSGVTDMRGMFSGATSFDSDLSGWDISNVRYIARMFLGATSFDSDLPACDVSGVTDMRGMFADASSFDGDISAWDVSGVTDMRGMHHGAKSFNGDLSAWDVSSVANMAGMFTRASSFNGDLSGWDVSNVRNMAGMFNHATSFDSDLSGWDVSSVTDMSRMFSGSILDEPTFNGDLSGWDVSKVTGMRGMFSGATSFDSDLSGWDVSSVRNMAGMFNHTTSFDSDLSGWDVSSVRNMAGMFNHTTSFDSDLSGWDVSSVTDMDDMFSGASSFSQNLGNWYVVLDDTSTSIGSGSGIIGNIAAQNRALDGQSPTYGIGTGADSALFAVDRTALKIRLSEDYSGKTGYTVNITSTGDFGTNNFRMVNIAVMGSGSADPP